MLGSKIKPFLQPLFVHTTWWHQTFVLLQAFQLLPLTGCHMCQVAAESADCNRTFISHQITFTADIQLSSSDVIIFRVVT